MSDEQFKSVLDNIKKDNNIEDDAKFQEALKQEGMTLADLRRQLEKNMLETRVQQAEVMAKISVTEDEAQRLLRRTAREFTTPSATHAARNPGRGAGERSRRQRGGGRRGEGKGRRNSPSGAGRRAVRAPGCRSLRRAVEGERRTDRADQQRRAGAGAAEDPRRR